MRKTIIQNCSKQSTCRTWESYPVFVSSLCTLSRQIGESKRTMSRPIRARCKQSTTWTRDCLWSQLSSSRITIPHSICSLHPISGLEIEQNEESFWWFVPDLEWVVCMFFFVLMIFVFWFISPRRQLLIAWNFLEKTARVTSQRAVGRWCAWWCSGGARCGNQRTRDSYRKAEVPGSENRRRPCASGSSDRGPENRPRRLIRDNSLVLLWQENLRDSDL